MRSALAVENRKSNRIERPSLVKNNVDGNVDGNGHLGVDQCNERYHQRRW